MDKIKALFEQAGVNPELAERICAALEEHKAAYRTAVKEGLEADYAGRLEQAKKICLEETEAHKREMARRLQIFCETKNAAIEAAIRKSTAIRESESSAKLRQVTSILHGQTPIGGQAGQSQAVESLQKQVQALKEERDRAVTAANRQTAIAEKVLTRNRELERTVTLAEGASRPPRPAPHEGGRLDAARRRQAPTTTRPTIVENQQRQPQPRQAARPQPGINIAQIAATIDD